MKRRIKWEIKKTRKQNKTKPIMRIKLRHKRKRRKGMKILKRS